MGWFQSRGRSRRDRKRKSLTKYTTGREGNVPESDKNTQNMSQSLAFFITFLLLKHSKDCQRIMRQIQDAIFAQRLQTKGSRKREEAGLDELFWDPATVYRLLISCMKLLSVKMSACPLRLYHQIICLYLLCKTVFPSQSGDLITFWSSVGSWVLLSSFKKKKKPTVVEMFLQ